MLMIRRWVDVGVEEKKPETKKTGAIEDGQQALEAAFGEIGKGISVLSGRCRVGREYYCTAREWGNREKGVAEEDEEW
jgi:hypothetical protein